MRQIGIGRQYQFGKAWSKSISSLNEMTVRIFRMNGQIRSLARDRALQVGCGADIKCRRRRIVDDPDRQDNNDQ